MKQKLIDLMIRGFFEWNDEKQSVYEAMADCLIENGVTIPEHKAGDKVYFVFFDDDLEIWDYSESTVKDVCDRGIFVSPFLDEREEDPEHWELMMFDDEDMFFSKEDAKKAIGERSLIGE